MRTIVAAVAMVGMWGAARDAAAMWASVEHVSKFAAFEARIPLPVHRPGQPVDMAAKTSQARAFLGPLSTTLDRMAAVLRKSDGALASWLRPWPKTRREGGLAVPSHSGFMCKGIYVPRITIRLEVAPAATPLAEEVAYQFALRAWHVHCGGRRDAVKALDRTLAELATAKDSGLVESIEPALRFQLTRAYRARLSALARKNPVAAPAAVRMLAALPDARAAHLLPLVARCAPTLCRAVVVALVAVPGGLAALRRKLRGKALLLARALKPGEVAANAAWLRQLRLPAPAR